MKKIYPIFLALPILFTSCNGGSQKSPQSGKKSGEFKGAKREVKLMILDPGHFHAGLVQKDMYDQVDPTVFVYAPEGAEVQDHLKRVEGFNTRPEKPTSWIEKVYTGTDYLEKMLAEKPGNVVVISGNNAKKTDYILKSVEAGLNVLGDKPMVISPEEFPKLEKAFQVAQEKGVLLYDIMTERFEITTILQRELTQIPEVFGEIQKGTPENPAILMESVHCFYKNVSGSALKRPAWFFDVKQQGEGITDVATHLVDLIQWEIFPETKLSKADVEMGSAKRWTTSLTPEMFKKVTGLDSFPKFLQKDVENNILKVYSNGEINYKLKSVCAKVKVTWDFEAPTGAGDAHYSTMSGSLCDIIIRQGKEEDYKPTLYIKANIVDGLETFSGVIDKAFNQDLAVKYPGIKLKKLGDRIWIVEIPEIYKVGHEAHFTQVTKNYLGYLKAGRLPDWEVTNMIVKYYTTTEALKKAIE